MKKKLTALLLVMVMAAVTAACGSAAGSTPKEAKQTGNAAAGGAEASQDKAGQKGILPANARIGVCLAKGSSYRRTYSGKLLGYLEKKGFAEDNIVVLTPAPGKEKEAAKLLIAGGCNVVIVDCGDPENAAGIREEAVNAGVPLIFVITEPSEEETGLWEKNGWKVSFIGGDKARIGELREVIIDSVDYETLDVSGDHYLGCIVLDVADSKAVGVSANQATLQALETNHYKTTVLSHMVFKPVPNEDEESGEETEAYNVWDLDPDIDMTEYESYDDLVYEIGEILSEFGKETEVILCADDGLACAAADALEQRRRKVEHDVQILGTEATRESLEQTASGKILGTVFTDYLAQSKAAAEAALDYCKEENVPHIGYYDYVKVTIDNAREILDVTASEEADSESDDEDSEEGSEDGDDEGSDEGSEDDSEDGSEEDS